MTNKIKHKLYFVWDDRQAADPFKDGYIGVTTQSVDKRVGFHKTSQYSGLSDSATSGNRNERKMYKILKEIPDEHIQHRTMMWHHDPEVIAMVEAFFRPTSNIGWNSHPGGRVESESRPFVLNFSDGTSKPYNTIAEAGRDGINIGSVSRLLRGLCKCGDIKVTDELRATGHLV